ncbi:TIGR02679 family protein [Neobacillus sp. 3P2-tot-E-2]|uniref:TIGR02679 family protein n=1 Tax=Neobacillus sp. 3P2-tot-E-2 TaxID=3132212 RepID=UPI00399F0FD5
MNKKIQVFQKEPGFLKLFSMFKEKYRSLGRVGGTVSLKNFNQAEIESLAGFLGVSKEQLQRKGSVALVDFEKELANTGFSDFSLLQLLQEVLQETIFTKKEELVHEQKEEELFFDFLKQEISYSSPWLDWISSKSTDTRWIWSLYNQNKTKLREQLVTVSKAFEELPQQGDFERLPFFSQRVTGNPHSFDSNEVEGRLLLHCMYVDQVLHGNKDLVMPRNVEELNDLYGGYGLLRDDLWNFVTCQGLLASIGDILHPVWQAAVHTQMVMNLPMKELTKVERVWPAKGLKVWIVENSSVCSTIMDAVPDAPVICTHGQLRVAGWLLLDKLVESDCTLYYSGDLDPEGIVIADRLKKRYKDRIVLWNMDINAYKASVSNEDITNRISKLESVSSPEWMELICLMKDVKMAGYQEAITSSLISEIKQNIH